MDQQSASYGLLKEKLFRLVELQPEEWAYFEQHLRVRSFERGEFLTRIGEVEDSIYFVASGLVKIHFLRQDLDICVDFAMQHDIVSSFISFATRKPSRLHLQAVTPVQVLYLSYVDIQRGYNLYKNHERLGRLLLQNLYIRKCEKEMTLLSHTVEERYREFLDWGGELIQQISIKDIASYLGIHPESLSRIRKNLMRSEKN
ncbi:MAG: Crp/Fnr family transcriptional regulator [Sphingobacteriaceae bacterium]|nr:Crp/Fnr family transcriptional regulator [Cytophagaceae bacterium]